MLQMQRSVKLPTSHSTSQIPSDSCWSHSSTPTRLIPMPIPAIFKKSPSIPVLRANCQPPPVSMVTSHLPHSWSPKIRTSSPTPVCKPSMLNPSRHLSLIHQENQQEVVLLVAFEEQRILAFGKEGRWPRVMEGGVTVPTLLSAEVP